MSHLLCLDILIHEIDAHSLRNRHLGDCLTSYQQQRRGAMVVCLGVTTKWVRVGNDTLVDMVVVNEKRSSTDIEQYQRKEYYTKYFLLNRLHKKPLFGRKDSNKSYITKLRPTKSPIIAT